jgi:hypothetical protein
VTPATACAIHAGLTTVLGTYLHGILASGRAF